MKRAGFLAVAAIAAAISLALAEAADAAVRYVKSPSDSGSKQTASSGSSGNVRRSGSVGNVRSSGRSDRQPSSSSRRVVGTTPTVTRAPTTSSSTRRSSSSSSSSSSVYSGRSSSSGRHPSSSSTTHSSSSSVSRTPGSSGFSSRGRTVRTPTSGRTGYARSPNSTVGNVRRSRDTGNVTYSYLGGTRPVTPPPSRHRRRHDDDDDDNGITYARFVNPDLVTSDECECDRRHDPWRRRRRRPHDDDNDNGITYARYVNPNVVTADERECDRRHHGRKRHPHCLPSPIIFIYRYGGTFIYVHSGRYGPYWYGGRWHPYRADCPRVLYYGYWIDTRDTYYVNRLEPPWADEDYGEPAVDRTGRVSGYEVDDAYRDFIRKGQIHDAVIAEELSLSTTEARRALVLIHRGIIQDVLNEGSQRGESDYDFDERRGLLTLTAPSEKIAMIETMVRDRRTFVALTELNRYGNSAAVIPVASPFYLEQDFRGAVQLATDNLDALRRMLQERDWRYAYRDKECWLNAEYGTVTVVDDHEGIERALALMKQRPFVPRELVHE